MKKVTVVKKTTIQTFFEGGFVTYTTGPHEMVSIIKHNLGRSGDNGLTFKLENIPSIIAALQELVDQVDGLEE